MTRRKRYSAEFKREALRRANKAGVTDVLVAEKLGINARLRFADQRRVAHPTPVSRKRAHVSAS